jgi:hypothetical protein
VNILKKINNCSSLVKKKGIIIFYSQFCFILKTKINISVLYYNLITNNVAVLL